MFAVSMCTVEYCTVTEEDATDECEFGPPPWNS